MKYRIVELRPDVFSVEEFKSVLWFWPFYKDWCPVKSYVVPAIPEYSPIGVTEFTRQEAEAFIKTRTEMDDVERLRRHPPAGYPRII